MLTTRIESEEIISIEQFRERVLAKARVDDPESMMALAPDIVALANNPDLLATRFTKELGHWDKGGFSLYSPQSCVLDSFGCFVVRVNFWPLLPSDPRRRNILARVLSYDDCHDHNFSFLTTNYYGPGYETEVFEYDWHAVDGLLGEKVDLVPQGRKRLDKGKVMLFRTGREVHTQIPPPDVSASINLLMSTTGGSLQDQYYFDLDRREICGYVESVSSKRNSLFGFAAQLGDARTDELLRQIATTYPSPRTRACALESLARRHPDRAGDLARLAAADPAAIVRSVMAERVPC